MFALTPNAAKTKWTHSVLHSFCAQGAVGCLDSLFPVAGPIKDAAGQFYGTTETGGAHGLGTVFQLTSNAAKSKWTVRVLYSFCAQGGFSCTDGRNPLAGLISDAAGHLYGTTDEGGAHGAGTIFELTFNAAKSKWMEAVLHSFGAGSDGQYPFAALIMDTSGHLYGTTNEGGAHGFGTAFALTPNAAKTKWTYSVLYSFCAQGGCKDGDGTEASLTVDAAGKLYDTTAGGVNGGGAVFELAPKATRTKWTETVLYGFCARGGENCTDGKEPLGGLIMDASGHLYGTTYEGGAHLGGTVFELP